MSDLVVPSPPDPLKEGVLTYSRAESFDLVIPAIGKTELSEADLDGLVDWVDAVDRSVNRLRLHASAAGFTEGGAAKIFISTDGTSVSLVIRRAVPDDQESL